MNDDHEYAHMGYWEDEVPSRPVGGLVRPPAEPIYAFNDVPEITLSPETKPLFTDIVVEALAPAILVTLDEKDEAAEQLKKVLREFVTEWVEDVPFYR